MAMAMPPSVIVLMVAPKARSTRTAAASDSGIAVKRDGGRAHVGQKEHDDRR